MLLYTAYFTKIWNNFLYSFPELFVNIWSQAIVSYLCLNLVVTPIFIACQTQLMFSVFAVLFFFINTALLLIVLGLEYLGLAILLVYAGAIIMILLFVIMLVKLQDSENQPFNSLSPIQWSSNYITISQAHLKTKSLFLILGIILGASILTYSCKSIIAGITPGIGNSIAPTFDLYSQANSKLTEQTLRTSLTATWPLLKSQDMPLFNTFISANEPNYIPWLFTYFNTLLETKFQPLVLENGIGSNWASLSLADAPSYNIDRLAMRLVGQFGKTAELVPGYEWNKTNLSLTKTAQNVLEHPTLSIENLIDYNSTKCQWDFYPRVRHGVYSYPEASLSELKANSDIPLIYAVECELKDLLIFPTKDITNISSVLYTLHAPTLVLASICLFVAMVLSFLLTNFKLSK